MASSKSATKRLPESAQLSDSTEAAALRDASTWSSASTMRISSAASAPGDSGT